MKKVVSLTLSFVMLLSIMMFTLTSCNFFKSKNNIQNESHPAEKYWVHFETNGGTEIESVLVENGNCVSIPQNPIREGYAFLGWYTDAECQNVFTETLPEGTDTITIYAKIKRERYTVPA